MRIKLTERSVAAIALPDDKPQIIAWDIELIGFGVVVGRQTRTFVVETRVAGRKVRTKIGIVGQPRDDGRTWNVALAKTEAKQLLGKMAGGVSPNVERRAGAGPTLREALDHHVTKMEAGENRRRKVCSPRSVRTIRGAIELHFARWLDRPLVDLDADAIESVLKHVLKTTERVAGSSSKNPPGRGLANRLLSNVGAVWNSWHRRHGLPVGNPTTRLMPGALAPRDTRVANDDLPAWHLKVQAMRDSEIETRRVRGDLQLVAMFTGVRTDGVRHLRWEDVDFDEELIHVARAKGDKPYTIPMVKTVREILERRQSEAKRFAALEKCKPWVFPSPDSAEGCVAEVKERRDIVDEFGDVIGRESHLVGVHASRRTFNSIAIEIGVPLEARERLMNHSGRGVNVKHYGQPQDWSLTREFADKIEAAIWQRIRGEGKPVRRGKLRSLP